MQWFYKVSAGRNSILVTLLPCNNCYKGGKKKENHLFCVGKGVKSLNPALEDEAFP